MGGGMAGGMLGKSPARAGRSRAAALRPRLWNSAVRSLGIDKQTRTIVGTVVTSISVCLGMWIERYTIVVPTLERPRLPVPVGNYAPSWLELSLMVGGFSAFALLYVLFVKLFPVVSLWEMKEGRSEAAAEAAKRIQSYFPSGAGSGERSAAS